MRLFRLYSGDDQQSHLEELKISFAPGQFAEKAPLQRATGVIFTRMASHRRPRFSPTLWHKYPPIVFETRTPGWTPVGLN